MYEESCDDADGDGICDDVDDCVGEYDECDVCNGPGAEVECFDGSFVCDAVDCPDAPPSVIEVNYDSDAPIAGFQFDVDGVTILNASGGAAEANGFMVSFSGSTVIGFSLIGTTVPPGSGVLVELEVEGNADEACLSNLVLSGVGGTPLDAFVSECFTIVYEEECLDYDLDGICDDEDTDDDNDCATDDHDSDDNNEFVCSDDDGDSCDDCSLGCYDPSNDGDDFDFDGICDAGDNDDDNDGVSDGDDCAPFDPTAFEEDCNGLCGGDAELDECGVCEGDNSSCTGCMDEDALNYDPDAILPCDDCCEYGPGLQYFTNLPEQTGVNQLVVIQNIVGLDTGDEVGLFDAEGLTNSGDCSSEYGEILVGAGVWTGSQLDLVGVGSIDNCDFGGFQLPGWVEENDIVIRVWDASENFEHGAEAYYSSGNGIWGDLLTVVGELDAWVYGCIDPEATNYDPIANQDDGSCEYTVTQEVGLNAFMLNNISFNVELEDSDIENVFGDAGILMVNDDAGGFYVPDYEINTIGSLELGKGYLVFLSGDDDVDISVTGYPDVVDTPIELAPFMLNNIAFLPPEPMSVADVMDGLPILLVNDEQGQFYVPSLGVNTIDENGGMQPGRGYQLFLTGEEGAVLVYDWDDSDGGFGRNTNNVGDLRDPVHYTINPTGISHPIVITELNGELQPGDELAVYADGNVVGATRIVDVNEPVAIAAWGGFNQFGVHLEGWETGETIELRLWSNDMNMELFVNANLDNTEFGNSPLTSGSITVENTPAEPEDFLLGQNYPNPFNPETTIEYVIPEDGFVSLLVIDITGRVITTLANDYQESGYYNIQWNGTDERGNTVSAGVYMYILQTENTTLTRKMVLMK